MFVETTNLFWEPNEPYKLSLWMKFILTIKQSACFHHLSINSTVAELHFTWQRHRLVGCAIHLFYEMCKTELTLWSCVQNPYKRH